MHTNLCVLIEISMEIGILNFWECDYLLVQRGVKFTLVKHTVEKNRISKPNFDCSINFFNCLNELISKYAANRFRFPTLNI